MTKSKKIFVCVSVALITSALFGSPLAALYLVMSPQALAPYTLFPPRKPDSYKTIDLKPLGVTGEQVKIPLASGGHLCAFYFPKPGAPYTVLISHGQGIMEFEMSLAHAALASNLSVLIYDYQGYGESSGKPSTSNLLSDGIAAFDYLVQTKKAKPNQIISMGSSLGTGIAANTALNRACAAVLLVAPYSSLVQAARDNVSYFKIYPSFLFPQPDLSCMPLMLTNETRPVVIIHGALDQRISVSHSRQLAAAYELNHQSSHKLNHQPSQQQKTQPSEQSQQPISPAEDDANFRYVELANCHHGDIPLDTITEELNRIVTHLERAKKALVSTK